MNDQSILPAPVVIVGLGEIGLVFAQGLLKNGHPILPVTRQQSLSSVLASAPDAAALLVAVAEKDLNTVLEQVPAAWHDRLILIQNELLPQDWTSLGIANPTVASIWFEKKPGKYVNQLMPSPVWGPLADLVDTALRGCGLEARIVLDAHEMLEELVIKNVYILTTNIAGLKVGGDVAALWQEHEDLARAIAAEVIDIQEKLIGQVLTPEPLIEGMLAGFEGDPSHACKGRTAEARLHRALALARKFNVATPRMDAIAAACASA
ncbi:MAG TPA: hypothetical protein VMV35_03250 [Halothiobacillus sp.]|nr:hypothetical protein [Halothiobacillus sp.]